MTVSLVDLLYLVIIICSITLTVAFVISLNRLNTVLDELKRTSGHVANLTSTLDRLNSAVTPAVGAAVMALKKFTAKAAGPKKQAKKTKA